jgi:hypothetical protein
MEQLTITGAECAVSGIAKIYIPLPPSLTHKTRAQGGIRHQKPFNFITSLRNNAAMHSGDVSSSEFFEK